MKTKEKNQYSIEFILSQYLPYKPMILWENTHLRKMIGLKDHIITYEVDEAINGGLTESIHNYDGKLVLRPYDDMAKYIIHNGKKFIPLEIIGTWSAEEEENYKIYGTLPEYWKSLMGMEIKYWDYLTVMKALNWKIDIFNLIPSGKAVSVHELKKNPYL